MLQSTELQRVNMTDQLNSTELSISQFTKMIQLWEKWNLIPKLLITESSLLTLFIFILGWQKSFFFKNSSLDGFSST